jgi:hypothetical protein
VEPEAGTPLHPLLISGIFEIRTDVVETATSDIDAGPTLAELRLREMSGTVGWNGLTVHSAVRIGAAELSKRLRVRFRSEEPVGEVGIRIHALRCRIRLIDSRVTDAISLPHGELNDITVEVTQKEEDPCVLVYNEYIRQVPGGDPERVWGHFDGNSGMLVEPVDGGYRFHANGVDRRVPPTFDQMKGEVLLFDDPTAAEKAREDAFATVNAGLRKIVPGFDVRDSYSFWSRKHRKFTGEEKKAARGFLEPLATTGWDGVRGWEDTSYVTHLAFATLVQMGVRDVDSTGPAEAFQRLSGCTSSKSESDRLQYAEWIERTMTKQNWPRISEFLRWDAGPDILTDVGVDSSRSRQRDVAAKVLGAKSRRESGEFSWLREDERYRDLW